MNGGRKDDLSEDGEKIVTGKSRGGRCMPGQDCHMGLTSLVVVRCSDEPHVYSEASLYRQLIRSTQALSFHSRPFAEFRFIDYRDVHRPCHSLIVPLHCISLRYLRLVTHFLLTFSTRIPRESHTLHAH